MVYLKEFQSKVESVAFLIRFLEKEAWRGFKNDIRKRNRKKKNRNSLEIFT